MKPVTLHTTIPTWREGSEIPITPTLREAIRLAAKDEMSLLFQNLRLDLQSRILGLADKDLVKLQGKLEYLSELENFFQLVQK